MNNTLKTLALVASFLPPLAGSAAVMFEDDFNEYANGLEMIGASGTQWGASANSQTESPLLDVFTVLEDSNDYFGAGTSNKYVEMAVTSTISQYSIVMSAHDFSETSVTGQVSFKFYDPTDASSIGSGWALRIGDGYAGNGNTCFGIILNEGVLSAGSGTGVNKGVTLTNYSMDTAHTVTIVYNNSASSFDYSSKSVASKTMDVYLDGILIGDDVAGSGGHGVSTDPIEDPLTYDNISNINFTSKSYSDFQDTLNIDDVIVSTDISIPEPSTSAFLIGISVLLVTFLRRRLKGARR
ncbi:hypothetical protein [Ruficoccus sp. ZRK36]|uniref:hypothetical protein n=1 Tax=Ruficoccus sp. ZRK36 TaxID=2866311 RepID=UPI001C733752|nr:hypothetical protein [Ruficoccus sp. ZRK36]QYY35063.1 hypothetical protein K0V07_12220 [Ruficoccus sp. ZRK36]